MAHHRSEDEFADVLHGGVLSDIAEYAVSEYCAGRYNHHSPSL